MVGRPEGSDHAGLTTLAKKSGHTFLAHRATWLAEAAIITCIALNLGSKALLGVLGAVLASMVRTRFVLVFSLEKKEEKKT